MRIEVQNPSGSLHRSTRQHIDRNDSQAHPALIGFRYRACVITTGTSGCPGGQKALDRRNPGDLVTRLRS